jgi:hypothetical protein
MASAFGTNLSGASIGSGVSMESEASKSSVHKEDIRARMEGYVRTIKSPDSTKVEVESTHSEEERRERVSQSCCSLFWHCRFREICTSWRLCERSMCCLTQTVTNIEITTPERFSVSPESRKGITHKEFFFELRNEYGEEYFPILYECAIDYMAEAKAFPRELEFWRHWDPKVEGVLEQEKINFFKELLKDAATIMRGLRTEIMRRHLNKRMSEPDVLDEHIMGRDRAVSSPLHEHLAASELLPEPVTEKNKGFLAIPPMQEDAMQYSRQASKHSPKISPKSSPECKDKEGSPSKESKASAESKAHSSAKSCDEDTIERAPLPQLHIFDVTAKQSSSPVIKGVRVGDALVEFSHQKVIEDLLLLTKCTLDQAEDIASAIEENLSFPCSRRQILDAIKKEVQRRNIEIKESASLHLYNTLLDYMEEHGYLKIKEIPREEFRKIRRHFTRALVATVQEKENSSRAVQVAQVARKTLPDSSDQQITQALERVAVSTNEWESMV